MSLEQITRSRWSSGFLIAAPGSPYTDELTAVARCRTLGFSYEIRIESNFVLILNSNFQMQAHELANFKPFLGQAARPVMWQFLRARPT